MLEAFDKGVAGGMGALNHIGPAQQELTPLVGRDHHGWQTRHGSRCWPVCIIPLSLIIVSLPTAVMFSLASNDGDSTLRETNTLLIGTALGVLSCLVFLCTMMYWYRVYVTGGIWVTPARAGSITCTDNCGCCFHPQRKYRYQLQARECCGIPPRCAALLGCVHYRNVSGDRGWFKFWFVNLCLVAVFVVGLIGWIWADPFLPGSDCTNSTNPTNSTNSTIFNCTST